MADFGQQVEALVDKYKKRLRATAKESVQEVVRIAQHPRDAGGRMPIITGFLRASIMGNVGSMPSGKSVALKGETFNYSGEAIAASTLVWNPNLEEVLFIGWTANYARTREHSDGFLRGATEKWESIVDATAKRVKARI